MACWRPDGLGWLAGCLLGGGSSGRLVSGLGVRWSGSPGLGSAWWFVVWGGFCWSGGLGLLVVWGGLVWLFGEAQH
eukprot:3019335-Amphidinium_carterae.1